jgi:hypothetical protein
MDREKPRHIETSAGSETQWESSHTIDGPDDLEYRDRLVASTWEEIFHLITPHEKLLKALLAPFSSLDEHYHNLLEAALQAGFHAEGFLLGLLLNSPQGDASVNPERGYQLKRMVCDARSKLVDGSQDATSQPQPDKGVLVSRSRFEEMLGELKRLKEKAAELEVLLLDWRKRGVEAPATVNAVPMAAPLPDRGGQSSEGAPGSDRLFEAACESFMRGEHTVMHYSQINTEAPKGPPPEGIEATVQTCLLNNPDLAGDPDKLRMVQYCFTNYVNIDPGLSDLSLRERLERASQMAREFLGY